MTDPIGAAKIGGDMAKQLSGAGKTSAPHGKFEQLRTEKAEAGQDKLSEIDKKLENLQETGKLDQSKEVTMAQRVAAKDGITNHPGLQKTDGAGNVWKPQTVQATGHTAQVAEGIKDFNSGQQRLDTIMKELQSGKKYSKEELLGLQMEVNVLSEQMQMTTKLVDSAMQSVKQVMQQQV
jgi:hypothetical protein